MTEKTYEKNIDNEVFPTKFGVKAKNIKVKNFTAETWL